MAQAKENPKVDAAATVVQPMDDCANGGSLKGKSSSPSPSDSVSMLAILGCLVIVALSFTAGVFTPPALSFREAFDSQQRKLARAHKRRIVKNEDSCSEETLSQFLHDDPARGLHFVCLAKNGTMTLYRSAVASGAVQMPTPTSWQDLKGTLVQQFGLRPEENKQSWAIFNSRGVKIATGDDTEVDMRKLQGLSVVFRGGQWMWPGVRIGFRRTIDLSYVPGYPRGGETRTATLETLSLHPLVVSVEGFLSDQECDRIQELASPDMRYSGVTLKDVDKGRPASDFRTSQSTFLAADDDTLKAIDYRTASLVRIPRSHQEYVQVLRYGHTEHYDAHHDYFDPTQYKDNPGTLRTIQNGRRNRMATVFWYLSNVAEGGETVFPRFNGAPQPTDFKDCSKGLLVKPERGKVIIFYSLLPDGRPDVLSLHGACAVKDGVKWAANKWVWNLPMEYIANP